MKTYNVELQFPDPQSKQDWVSFLEMDRVLFNEISQIIFNEKLPLSLKILHDRCYYKLRERYPSHSSQMIIKAEQAALQNYKTVRTLIKRGLQKELQQPIEKKNLSMRIDKAIYSKFSKESISLISSVKNKRSTVSLNLYPKIEEIFTQFKTKDPLIFERDGKLFLSIPFETPEIAVPKSKETILGVDLGIRRIAATSDGLIIESKNLLKQKRRIRYLKRSLQSKGTKSAKKRLRKVRKHEGNISKNFAHHVANEILKTDKTVIVLEDLTKIKQSTSKLKNGFKRTKHNNQISQIPFYLLKEILTYKAQALGKRVETVNPAFTSQDDYRGLERGERKGCRYYAVDGRVLDADGNAACNIALRYSKHPLSFLPAIDGSYKPKRQGAVNHPIVSILRN